jgi:DNA-binding transcriptional LysR family regulator
MELRHLRYFTAVAEESTLIAAAKRLGVAQPALTRQIHALEHELDVELLERGPKGTSLTPAGEVVLASARHVVREVDAAVQKARDASRGMAGRCVLCAGVRALASGFVARVLARIAAEYPNIEMRVVEGTLIRQFRILQLGEADIGIGVTATRDFPELASETLHISIFDMAAFANSHPFAKRESVSIHELAGETFIAWGGEIAVELRRMIEREFKRIHFVPAKQRAFEQPFAIASAVAANQGWTLVPNDAHALAPPGTTVVKLTDFMLALAHAMVWRKDDVRPIVRTVMDVIRRIAAEQRHERGDNVPLPASPRAPLSTAMSMGVIPSAVLELRHLRYFRTVAEAGSFGRAAEQLELTQPALSRQVGDLERVVGVPLLERAARGVSTTPAGDSLLTSARRVLDEVGTMAAEAHRARRGVIARCLIAAVPTTAARALITALVHDSARDAPHLELHFEDYTTPGQPGALRKGRIDLGLCHASAMSALAQRMVERIRLTSDLANCALVSAANPLAQREQLSLSDLAEIPFLFPDRDFQPEMYDDMFGEFERQAFRPRVDATYDGLDTIWSLVAQNRGWAIGFASQCELPPVGTRAVPLEDFSVPWGLDLLMRDDESRSLILDVADRLRRLASTMS